MTLDKTQKIYVAGHRGLVGSALVRALTALGCSKLILRTRRELDLRVQSDVQTFFETERPDVVLLAAAKVGGILANSTYKAEFIYDNLSIAANVIDASYRSGVRHLLNLGSSCIYPKLAPQPLKEEYLLTGPLEETNEPYAIAKIAAIKLCHYYNEQYKTMFRSAMPTNLYGPGDNFNLETAHVLPSMIRKFHLGTLLRRKATKEILADVKRFPLGFGFPSDGSGETVQRQLKDLGVTADAVTLWGTGTPRREFLYVDDLATAALHILNEPLDKIGELVNIGAGEDLPISDLASLAASAVGYEGEVRFDHSHPDGTPRKLLDVSKLNRLGWNASVPLQEGIRRTYHWYLNSIGTSPETPQP